MRKIFAILCVCVLIFVNTKIIIAGGGPDLFGYTWKDSFDPGGPVYAWVDISLVGTPVPGLLDDNADGPKQMGMSFRYYWSDYDDITIGSNGWVSFDNVGNIAHCFPRIPEVGGSADNIIAPMMTDLIFNNNVGNTGKVLTHHDVVNNRYIVSYINVPWWTATAPNYVGSNTFQLILDGTDSSITFQYQDVDQLNFNNMLGCAADLEIGIENITGDIGLEIYNDVVPPDNYAIKFYYPQVVTYAIQDATPEWTQTDESRGAFYPTTRYFDLISKISNVGNTNFSSSITADAKLTGLNMVDQYMSTTNISSLPASTGNTVTFAPPISMDSTGQFSYRVETSSTTDINATNDVKISEIGLVDINQDRIMLSYATQGPSNGNASWSGGGGIGIYMKPPSYNFIVDSISIFIANVSAPGNYIVQLIDDNGPFGRQGTVLSADTVLAGSYTVNSWVTTGLSNPTKFDSGGFYVGWIELSAGTIGVGTETAGPMSRQGYEYLGSWAGYRTNETQEFLINVHMAGTCPDIVPIETNIGYELFGLDGSIDVSVSGGVGPYTFEWFGPNGYTSNDEDPTGLATGDYELTVLDADGCMGFLSVFIPSHVGIADNPTDSYKVEIYPNPFRELLIVDLQEMNLSRFSSITLLMHDVFGRVVLESRLQDGEQNRVNTVGLGEGLFLYQIVADETFLRQGCLVK